MGRLWLTGAEVDASCLDMATVKWSEWKPQGHRHTRDLLTVISVCMRQNTWLLCIHLLQHLQATANQRVGRLTYCVFTGDIYFWWVIMFLLLCRLDVQFSIYPPFRTMEALDFPHLYIYWPNQWRTRVDCLIAMAIICQMPLITSSPKTDEEINLCASLDLTRPVLFTS